MSLLRHQGQSLVEFALILPIFVLIVVGVFDLGRAFFAFITISNAAREGVRVYTFDKEAASVLIIRQAVQAELNASDVIEPSPPPLIEIHCTNSGGTVIPVPSDTELKLCKAEEPIVVTVTYIQPMILSFFFPGGLTLVRSAEMMVP